MAGSPIVRAMSETGGRVGSSVIATTRCASARSTPATPSARDGSSLGKVATSPPAGPLAARR